jgi:hypothetical protein
VGEFDVLAKALIEIVALQPMAAPATVRGFRA